jgi:hypothetical protein
MILDQTIGVHGAQDEGLGLVYFQTWLMGTAAEVPVVNSLIGQAGLRSRLDGLAGQRSRMEGDAGQRPRLAGTGGLR